MTKATIRTGSAVDRRPAVRNLLQKAARSASSERPIAQMDDLESRTLFSHGLLPFVHALPSHRTISTPDFVIRRSSSGQAHPNTSTSAYGLTPSQVRHAYGIDQAIFGSITGDGSGQTIAIIDAYNAPTIVSDLHTFDAQFGLADPTSFKVVNQSGGTSLPGTDPTGRGNSWAIETSLDVEWAHAVAPKANILLVEANSAYDSDLFAAIDTARRASGVSVVSMSWGGGESSGQSSYDQYFTTPAGHNGVTFVASSGDSGAYDYYNTGSFAVEYPAASPNVLAVGGTYLSTDSSGNYLGESGWGNGTSSGSYGGSGGGLSNYTSQPAYQRGIVTQSTTKRGVPDVAFLADPASGVAVIDSWDFPSGPWLQVGGTSLAAPMWAGVIAIADQGKALAGQGTLDGATGTLPKIYGLSSSDFHDITSGNNGFAAGPGYDLVTGRGTPIVNRLVADLAGAVIKPQPTVGSFTVNPASVVSSTSVTLTASNVAETGGTIRSVQFYRESNGTAGWQTGDTLIGTGTQNGTTWSIATSTAGFGGGSYTYYAVATDTASAVGPSVSANLTVVTPTIGSLTVSPSTVQPGATVTITATNVAETGGSVSTVKFYRESNGSAGWQSSDTLLGTGTRNGSTWTFSTSTIGLATGTYSFYAVATDAASVSGSAASTQLVIGAAASSNNNFASAAILSGTSATATGTNVGATKEAGEPNHANNAGGKSVWWNWTAPASGTVSVNTHGSSFDTLLAVYTGNSVSALTRIASNDDDPAMYTLTSALSFNAAAGTTYRIAVDGYNGASGSITLGLSQVAAVAAPANDAFASAAALSGNSLTWTGSNVGATKQTAEPNATTNAGGASVWFTWTAPSTRTVSLNTKGSGFDTLLAVYTGNSLTSLSKVASNDDDPAGGTRTSALTFNAVAGTTYRFQVDGYSAATGAIVLNLA